MILLTPWVLIEPVPQIIGQHRRKQNHIQGGQCTFQGEHLVHRPQVSTGKIDQETERSRDRTDPEIDGKGFDIVYFPHLEVSKGPDGHAQEHEQGSESNFGDLLDQNR